MHPRLGKPPLNVRVCHQMSAELPPPRVLLLPQKMSLPNLRDRELTASGIQFLWAGAHTFTWTGVSGLRRSSSESLRTMGFLFHANARLETVCIFVLKKLDPTVSHISLHPANR